MTQTSAAMITVAATAAPALTAGCGPNASGTLNASGTMVQERGLADDVLEFGADVAVALAELPTPLAQLNRSYRRQVEQRTLLRVPDLREWCGQPVRVFLRHSTVSVFAIARWEASASLDVLGMANYVRLSQAEMVVDACGRQQTLRQVGPLSNRTTVHAFVSGTLTEIEDVPPEADLSDWVPVSYRPQSQATFVVAGTDQPVITAETVLLLPGTVKVWCRGLGGRL